MRRSLKNIILLVVLAIALIWLLQKRVAPSIASLFKPKPVVIDETPILIKQVRAIGELITAVASNEVVLQSVLPTRGSGFVNSVNKFAPVDILPSADKRLVLIGKGKVFVGTDFTKITDNGVVVTGDTVKVLLPKATVLDAVMNPSDFETFVETGTWSNEEVIALKAKARQQMIDKAIAGNIFTTANNKAKAVIEQFFLAAGYEVVLVKMVEG